MEGKGAGKNCLILKINVIRDSEENLYQFLKDSLICVHCFLNHIRPVGMARMQNLMTRLIRWLNVEIIIVKEQSTMRIVS